MQEKKTQIQKTMTPLELLKSEQFRLKRQSKQMEKELTADFQYIQENAGSLLISTVSSLFFPHSKAGKRKSSTSEKSTDSPSASMLAAPELLSVAGGILPLAWSVVQPIVLAWGMKKVKNLFSRVLFKKKA